VQRLAVLDQVRVGQLGQATRGLLVRVGDEHGNTFFEGRRPGTCLGDCLTGGTVGEGGGDGGQCDKERG
jgi:hypothetical protein